MAFTGWLLSSGPGCATELPELPRSLGNLDSTRDAGPREHPGTTEIGETSEWEVIREASKPHWAREEKRAAHAPPEDLDRVEISDRTVEEGAPQTPPGSPDDALVVVDRQHGLPPDYVPEDLVFLHPLGIPTLGGGSMKLRDEPAEAAAGMLADARSAGLDLLVCSAYRSHEAQIVSYGRLTAVYGENARDFSAPPGHSEHQLGTAIDLSNTATNCRLDQSFGETRASEWLRRNAADYGFVLSYPRGAEEHTGYSWEPWHYRYIGRENARSYHSGDYESPQQFFLREGVHPSE